MFDMFFKTDLCLTIIRAEHHRRLLLLELMNVCLYVSCATTTENISFFFTGETSLFLFIEENDEKIRKITFRLSEQLTRHD